MMLARFASAQVQLVPWLQELVPELVQALVQQAQAQAQPPRAQQVRVQLRMVAAAGAAMPSDLLRRSADLPLEAEVRDVPQAAQRMDAEC